MRIGRSSRTTRLVAGVAGLGVAVGAIIISHPAGASTTVSTQLSFSGVTTSTSPVGGSVVGVHPGDSVDLKPATVPTQGLNNLGVPLGDLLGNVLGGVTGYQVVLHLPANFPGGQRDVKLGACGSKPDLKVNFPKAGTYNFTWSAYAVNLLCLLPGSPITLDGNAAKKYGIALNASNQWIGKVVVATDPPAGGLSVQLPGISVAPSVGGVQLPTVGVPGANLPTVPVVPPSLNPGLPTGAQPSSPAGGSSGINYTPPGGLIQDSVVPKGYGPNEGNGHDPDAALNTVLLNGLSGGTGAVPNDLSGALPGSRGSAAPPVPTRSGQPIDLAANRAPAGQMPVLLAILAIIALSLVTATYARLYLMRRSAG
jgi:hypothetical protein